MDGREKQRFDPRSPVQPGRSLAPYLFVAILLAVAIWTLEHLVADSDLPTLLSGQSPEPARKMPTGPNASSGDVRTIFTADDYPARALAKGEQGTVQAELSIDGEGHVSRCSVLRSSGYSSLDAATCDILSRRARFTPARDAEGRAISSTLVTPPVRWQLQG